MIFSLPIVGENASSAQPIIEFKELRDDAFNRRYQFWLTRAKSGKQRKPLTLAATQRRMADNG